MYITVATIPFKCINAF